ncbi:hypothetical protein NDA14_002371 [Ustilago hordei]|nr:hypothetical protein NDA10_003825 [Ustilago hordei]KAJ1587258.1 hypothetical protein NDA15_003720 [Ustilago hordei]KAJ1590430.1 hypothetical protein NDA12_007250 [Ustilago hordei]KAJ1602166.1 hypothetical protein NDA14_002371 [Ustilago hordei]UTT96274.1 hypothetical protein NDA17_003655 [Ustilago hordei]
MVSFKPTPNLILMAFAAMQIAHAAPSTTVDVSTKDNDPEPGKPDNPLFACEIKSRTCREPANYTGLRYDPLNLNLGVCYDPSFVKDFYNWLLSSKKRGKFISTYYVSCPAGDLNCQSKCKGMTADKIENVVKDGIREQTDCHASVSCWDMEGLDKHCYKSQ